MHSPGALESLLRADAANHIASVPAQGEVVSEEILIAAKPFGDVALGVALVAVTLILIPLRNKRDQAVLMGTGSNLN
jgi:hypothetical protein